MKNEINLKETNETEKGYIIGFYVGDGNIFVKEIKGAYRLQYFLGIKEVTIQQKIIEIFKKICRFRSYKGKDNTYVIEIYSKSLINFIKKFSDKNGLKKEIFSREFLIGYIEGLIDSDGYVQRKYTEITTMNEKLKDNIVFILNNFGLNPNIRKFVTKNFRTGFRIGFSLRNKIFLPLKWVLGAQTAE